MYRYYLIVKMDKYLNNTFCYLLYGVTMDVKICSKCGAVLTEENWTSYLRKNHYKMCICCYRKTRNEYWRTHKEKRREQHRRWRERHREADSERSLRYWRRHKDLTRERHKRYDRECVLEVNGKKVFGIRKRPYTAYCEVCLKRFDKDRQLVYHHWFDDDVQSGKLVRGIWVCRACHNFVEKLDELGRDGVERYFKLKQHIVSGGECAE